MGTRDRDTFRRVAVSVLNRFSLDATWELVVLGSFIAAIGNTSSVLAEAYLENLGNGYRKKFVEYPIFDLLLLNRFLQNMSSVVFGSLDNFLMIEFIFTRLKGAEHYHWLLSRSGLCRVNVTGELSMP